MSVITSKFPGTCTKCGKSFPAGTSINWAPGKNPTHATPCDGGGTGRVARRIRANYPAEAPVADVKNATGKTDEQVAETVLPETPVKENA